MACWLDVAVALGVALASEAVVRVKRAMIDLRERERGLMWGAAESGGPSTLTAKWAGRQRGSKLDGVNDLQHAGGRV